MNSDAGHARGSNHFSKLTGIPDSRSSQGILARGSNVYSGGLPSAPNKTMIQPNQNTALGTTDTKSVAQGNPLEEAAKRRYTLLITGLR
ncbi:MAG: hypothetical protein ACRCZI_02330 [Cetobacterium sp.]